MLFYSHPAAAAVKFIVLSAPLAALLQTGDLQFAWAQQAERLGLVTAMAIAIAVLWKSSRKELTKKDDQLAEKDKQLIETAKQVTAAMISQAETSRELRKALEESVRAKQELKASIDLLHEGIGRLPCVHDRTAAVAAISRR